MRKPQKGTRPKLFYVGVDGDLLQPTMIEPQKSYLWADKNPDEDVYAVQIGKQDKFTPGVAREVYDVSHPPPWGKKIASYLWTKSIAAGVLLVASLLLLFGYKGEALLLNLTSPVLALFFTGVTTLLLVLDLKRPERFFYIFTKPNPKSWLVLGGYILMIYSVIALLWLLSGLSGGTVPQILLWSAAFLAVCSACYSAFLFAQAKGRDFWQSPLFFWHLLVQAITAGSAVLIICGAILEASSDLIVTLGRVLGISLMFSIVMILGEVSVTHVSEDVRRAAELLRRGALSASFWGLVVLGILLPLALLVLSALEEVGPHAPFVWASIFALGGLWFFEDLWIKAGQAVPLS
jgi:formate-dependent nitrite reductase membrane component NrfD